MISPRTSAKLWPASASKASESESTTKDDFHQDEAEIQRDSNQEFATEILGRVMVAMFVMGVPHGERAP